MPQLHQKKDGIISACYPQVVGRRVAETEMYVCKLIRQRLMDGCNGGEAAMWDTETRAWMR